MSRIKDELNKLNEEDKIMMKTIPKDHEIRIALNNLQAEDRNSPEALKLERFINADERHTEHLPMYYLTQLYREIATMLLKELRDDAPCPASELDDTHECTCGVYDQAMDLLNEPHDHDNSILPYVDPDDLVAIIETTISAVRPL
jgi:hypothetical protein